MITVPTITYAPTRSVYAWVSVAQSWTCWTYQGVRYRWIDGELFCTDQDGRHWWLKAAIGTWVHVQEIAAWSGHCRTLLATFGFEGAVLLLLYACLLVSLVLALIAQVAWLVAKRIGPRRELREVVDQRRRELDASVNLTERTR